MKSPLVIVLVVAVLVTLAGQRENYGYGNAPGYAQEYGYGPRGPFFQ